MQSFSARSGPGHVTWSYGKSGAAVQPSRRAVFIAGLNLVLTGAFLTVAAISAGHAADRPVRIVMLGDSIAAGFGLPAQDALPAKLERALQAKGFAVTIANAGVSGDTSAGGLARLDWSVGEGTDAVILELGANDALHGSDPQLTQKALDTIITRLTKRKIAVLLTGMQAPRNLGADYAKAFDPIYPALAAAHDVVFYPFILDGVAGNPALNQADGMHPATAGVDVIVERLLPKTEELVRRAKAGRS